MSKTTNNVSVNNAIESAKFDFNAPTSVSTEDRGKLGEVAVWKRVYKDEKGNDVEVAFTDVALVRSASRLDTLLAMREFSSLGVCYELSVLASKKSEFGFKSVGEIGSKLFGLKSATANQYARVGRLFVDMVESVNGVKYQLKPEYKGATVANLVQVLTLVDEKSDDPTENLISAISEDKLHLNGTLANLKKEVKAIQTGNEVDEDGNMVIDSTAKVVESKREDIATAIERLLLECENLEDDIKVIALEHITALQDIFTTKSDN